MLIRSVLPSDRAFVLSLVPRFVEWGCPGGQHPLTVIAAIERPLLEFFQTSPPNETLLIAENPQGEPLGYIYLKLQIDPFSGDRQGHVSHLVVSLAAEGQGVAKGLMQAGERWTQQQGGRSLTLSAFAGNQRARAFYEGIGFTVEMVKYRKQIQESEWC